MKHSSILYYDLAGPFRYDTCINGIVIVYCAIILFFDIGLG
jgi:hypothetical protein